MALSNGLPTYLPPQYHCGIIMSMSGDKFNFCCMTHHKQYKCKHLQNALPSKENFFKFSNFGQKMEIHLCPTSAIFSAGKDNLSRHNVPWNLSIHTYMYIHIIIVTGSVKIQHFVYFEYNTGNIICCISKHCNSLMVKLQMLILSTLVIQTLQRDAKCRILMEYAKCWIFPNPVTIICKLCTCIYAS